MKQSPLGSLKEVCTATAIKFCVSLLAQWTFLPTIGVAISFQQNLLFAVFMTFVSVALGYVIRRFFEWTGMKVPVSVAAMAVLAERQRQVTAEQFSAVHDDGHADGELALAGVAYVIHAATNRTSEHPPQCWPWERKWWKPQGFWRDLVRGCALILAEMDRALRLRARPAGLPMPVKTPSPLAPAVRQEVARIARKLKHKPQQAKVTS